MQEVPNCSGLIKHINDKMGKRANEQFRSHEITFMQMQVLLTLQCLDKKTEENAVPLKLLEKELEVAQSTAAGLIVRLEKKGLVSCFIPEKDKRLKYVQLTEKGKTYCLSAEADIQAGEQMLLSCLDDEEKEQFYHLLQKVNHSL